ncbi:hypothetical protein NQ318_001914 [Aromia moschata]|uniref:RNase H type-1 domain-containing protein n=1 Tax=Aromia moschata TaxID=1265417 RepID=A0AAV8Z1I5_9CUCU|nr:hypothetical protein NQ318_001914 [Aromia moschata]
MERFTHEQRWEILKNYFQSECCVAETVRKLRTIFGRNEAPSEPGVRQFLRKVRETGMLMDNRSHPRARPVRTAERIAAVAQSVCENPRTSTRHRAQQLNIITDNQAALKALKAVKIHSQVVKDCMDSLIQLAEHNSITLNWVRGHEGNERADFLAKNGGGVTLIGPEPAYRTVRRAI